MIIRRSKHINIMIVENLLKIFLLSQRVGSGVSKEVVVWGCGRPAGDIWGWAKGVKGVEGVAYRSLAD